MGKDLQGLTSARPSSGEAGVRRPGRRRRRRRVRRTSSRRTGAPGAPGPTVCGSSGSPRAINSRSARRLVPRRPQVGGESIATGRAGGGPGALRGRRGSGGPAVPRPGGDGRRARQHRAPAAPTRRHPPREAPSKSDSRVISGAMAATPGGRGTATSRFGVSRRESHDASEFYARFRAPEVTGDDRVAGRWTSASRCAAPTPGRLDLPDGCVALVVTSPPYFAGKEYEAALGEGAIPASYLEYLGMLRDVFAECERVLEPGGRIAVNVANLGRKPYRSLSADVIRILQDDLGLLLRGEVIWAEGRRGVGELRLGVVPVAGQPGPARRHRAGRHRLQGPVRPGPARRPPPGRGPAPPQHADQRRVPRRHPRPVADPGRERPAGRPPGAVPGRAAPAAHRALHLRRRPRPRPVPRLGVGGGGGRAGRAPLRRLRHRPRVRRHRPGPGRGGAGPPPDRRRQRRRGRGLGPRRGRGPRRRGGRRDAPRGGRLHGDRPERALPGSARP